MTVDTILHLARMICLSVAVIGIAAPPASACSVFAHTVGDHTVVGQNLDWRDPVPGCVVVNQRGIVKTVLPWKGDWPVPDAGEPIGWISRYGSVTFTCYGRDFIEGGMNEAGLMVDEANFVADYPPDDGRPGISCAQWMQYQLDCYATVDEVLDHLDELRPDGEGWHYLVADAAGRCAVIEYHRGEAVYFTGDAVEPCAITNTGYRQAQSHIALDTAFGGEIDIGSGSDSYGRYVRMAALMRDYAPEEHGGLVDHAFAILDDVGGVETRRSVVYDAAGARVWWKTPDNPAVRWLDLAALDFSPQVPTRMLDLDAGTAGDVSSLLVEYTLEANRTVVERVRDAGERSAATIELLRQRGLSYDEALDRIARHPTDGAR